MYHALKNTSTFKIFVLLTILCSYQCKGGREKRSSDGNSLSSRSNPHTIYGSSLGINRHPSRHTIPPTPYPHVYNAVKPVSPYSHPNEPLPGGVNPPPGVKQPYGSPRNYSRVNIYPDRTNHVTFGSHGHLPPPPPPPGFLNTRSSEGAAPFYTYYMNDFLSRGANSGLTAGLVLWEISKHLSHYHVYQLINHGYHIEAKLVQDSRTIKPGETYIILPIDLVCTFIIYGFKSINIFTRCDTNRNRVFNMVLPCNETIRVHCRESEGTCTASEYLSEDELTPINYDVFDEIAVYGAPLCKTTVISGGLEIDHEQYKKGVSPCVYPPYKWTGEEWINVDEKIQKEKIKENLNNVTKFEDTALNTLARYLPFGNFFSMFSNNTK